jgi:hypothetical protein
VSARAAYLVATGERAATRARAWELAALEEREAVQPPCHCGRGRVQMLAWGRRQKLAGGRSEWRRAQAPLLAAGPPSVADKPAGSCFNEPRVCERCSITPWIPSSVEITMGILWWSPAGNEMGKKTLAEVK